VLAALTEQAVCALAALSDDELTGALHAARRLENRAAYLQTLLIAEFDRRRAVAFRDAKARGVPPGRRPGEFAADELAAELVCTANDADARLERDAALATRLPRTLAGMAAGVISGGRADTIAAWTMSLSDADAARADEILAAAAPGLRLDQLSRKAAALELKLNPEGVRARKEHAKQTRQRVEVRREDTGNASIAGRELDTVDALGCKSYIDACQPAGRAATRCADRPVRASAADGARAAGDRPQHAEPCRLHRYARPTRCGGSRRAEYLQGSRPQGGQRRGNVRATRVHRPAHRQPAGLRIAAARQSPDDTAWLPSLGRVRRGVEVEGGHRCQHGTPCGIRRACQRLSSYSDASSWRRVPRRCTGIRHRRRGRTPRSRRPARSAALGSYPSPIAAPRTTCSRTSPTGTRRSPGGRARHRGDQSQDR
jgi:hypothetical protein